MQLVNHNSISRKQQPFRSQGTRTSHATLQLSTVREELAEVAHKWCEIGIQMGISLKELMELRKLPDPLVHVIHYWLRDNNVLALPPSWEALVRVLESSDVGHPALANRIRNKYCGRGTHY